jgi:hypothetical protein
VWAVGTRVLTAGTNIQLPANGLANVTAWTVDITGNITGNLSGSVGSVTGAVGSVTGNVGGNVTGTIGGLTAAALKDFFDTDSTTTYASAVAGSVVKEIADNAGGASLTVQDIVDGILDEATAGHVTAGTVGKALVDILADTNELQTDWTNGGRLDLLIDTIIDTTNSTYGAVDTEITNISSQLTTVLGRLTAARAGYLDNLNMGGVVASQATVDTLTGYVDTEVAAIKTQTDKLTFNGSNHVYCDVRSLVGATSITDTDRFTGL